MDEGIYNLRGVIDNVGFEFKTYYDMYSEIQLIQELLVTIIQRRNGWLDSSKIIQNIDIRKSCKTSKRLGPFSSLQSYEKLQFVELEETGLIRKS